MLRWKGVPANAALCDVWIGMLPFNSPFAFYDSSPRFLRQGVFVTVRSTPPVVPLGKGDKPSSLQQSMQLRCLGSSKLRGWRMVTVQSGNKLNNLPHFKLPWQLRHQQDKLTSTRIGEIADRLASFVYRKFSTSIRSSTEESIRE